MGGMFALLGATAGMRQTTSARDLRSAVVGDAPIERRAQEAMRGICLGIHDPRAVARILAVSSKCAGHDDLCRLAAGLDDLRTAIRYVADDETADLYLPYSDAIDEGMGDCSTMSVAIATHAAVNGMPVGACTIAQPNPKTGVVEWDHIYGLAWPRVRGIRTRTAADVSERAVPIGWEPQAWRVRDKRDWLYDTEAWERWYRAGAHDDNMPPVS